VVTASKVAASPEPSTEHRLARVEKTLSAIVRRFGIEVGDDAADVAASAPPPSAATNEASEEAGSSAAAPVFIIRDLANEMGIQSPDALRSQAHSSQPLQDSDLIGEGVLSALQASALLAM
jgi:hypothetical protein